MKCQLCPREAVSDMCAYHEAAREAVKAGYQKWVRAYGTFERSDYLDRVKRNVQTGRWAKEIAEFLLGGLVAKG